MIRPRRSLLFMPGSNARALEKARNLPADGLILDLEDSVAPEAKAGARDQIAQAVMAKGFGKREILIRTNGLDTSWWADDVAMAGAVEPDGILVPKVSSVEDLNKIGSRLKEIGAGAKVKVWAMIETARAVLDADKLAASVRDPKTRLAGFVFGPNDISRETRIKMLPGRAAMILRASATSSAGGVNTALQASMWLGWISVLPSKPRSRPCAHSAAKPSRFEMSP